MPPLIRISYEGDNDLMDKYHIAKYDLDGAVKSTVQMVDDAEEVQPLKYHEVLLQKKAIGYFITFKNCLYSFGIGLKYRIKDILIEWFAEVKKELGDTFICMLYDNNTRAIHHLQKQGMKIIAINKENKIITLQYNKPCLLH